MPQKISTGKLKSPGAFFGDLYGRVPKCIRITFCSALILGFLTHMYMFTNKFTNHDDTVSLFGNNYGAASGRWFLPFAQRLDGNFSMPWLTGVFCLVCLALTACFVVSLFRIKSPLLCILTSAVLVTFPTVTATFTYMFTATAYFLSLLLAAFGAWITVKYKWRGSILGVIALVLSMSCYQSYFPVAAVLMVGALLLETLDGDRKLKELIFEGLRLVITLAVAMVLYIITVRITTRAGGLVDYMGLQDMGKINFKELPELIRNSYSRYFEFFLHNDTLCHFNFLKYAFVLTGVGTVVMGIMLLVHRKLGIARTIFALALAAIYPLAGNVIYIMAPDADRVHELMIYGLCFILILPVFVTEYAGRAFSDKTESKRLAYTVVSWVTVLTIALTSYSYMITDNNAYLKIDLSLRQCEMYSNRLLERIESCEGYKHGMKVVLVGSQKRDDTLYPTPQLDAVNLIGVCDMAAFRTSWAYDVFLHYYMGFTGDIHLSDSEVGRKFVDMEEVKDMPCYPSVGSIQVIDDTLVVKMND